MILIFIFEIIGTIAFAVSGALIAIEKKLDIFGVIILSITTAVGGGIFRDIILGITPPVAFKNPTYCVISAISAIFTFYFYKKIISLKNVILILDAIGLGVFTALGSNAALTKGYGSPFIVISMGLFTGIGGGILRDVFAKNIPFVFKREIYAVASIVGGICFYVTSLFLNKILCLYLCLFVTLIIRLLSFKHSIHLPVADSIDEKPYIS